MFFLWHFTVAFIGLAHLQPHLSLFSAMEKIGQMTIKKNCKIAYLLALCIYDCDVLDANSVNVRCNCMSDLERVFCRSLR